MSITLIETILNAIKLEKLYLIIIKNQSKLIIK